jgi:nitrite reductase/ring-hydroxylating ferredoxin subunit
VLIAAGVLAAVPTAATGLNDWSDTYGADVRVGVVHAAVNSTALGLYVASLTARARGKRTHGKIIGLAGQVTLLAGSYLGGHLTFARGVSVNRTAWQDGPADWTPVLPAGDLPDGEHGVVTAAGVPILLYRNAGRVWALANTCSHMGGPLNEGAIDAGCVTCPWHGSVFRFADGDVARGPASSPQPCFEARVIGDQIEVRVAVAT